MLPTDLSGDIIHIQSTGGLYYFMKHCLEHYMLISRALVKAFSEQLPSFICWTLDFGGTSRHYIRTSGIKSSITHHFGGH